MDRRDFLRLSALGATGVAGVRLAGWAFETPLAGALGTGYFQHGVASGDPLPDGVVIWTRVTPSDGAVPGSGLGGSALVSWEVANDSGFSQIVRSGSVTTTAAVDHTVKVDVRGLAPASRYFYRFIHSSTKSPTGRTRTAPPSALPTSPCDSA